MGSVRACLGARAMSAVLNESMTGRSSGAIALLPMPCSVAETFEISPAGTAPSRAPLAEATGTVGGTVCVLVSFSPGPLAPLTVTEQVTEAAVDCGSRVQVTLDRSIVCAGIDGPLIVTERAASESEFGTKFGGYASRKTYGRRCDS